MAGVPLFLAMPPWCDVTLYQMAARNVLNGGVHYRDIFDTNLPGFVWLMALAKVTVGWDWATLRAIDLCVIGAATAVLCVWVRRCGGTWATVAWFAAAAALFYPFTSEFCHIQRDPWMLLPAALAAWLRLRRVSVEPPPPGPPSPEGREEGAPLRGAHEDGSGSVPASGSGRPSHIPFGDGGPGGGGPRDQPPSRGPYIRVGLLEGLLWGAAVWLKPHVIVPALTVWALSAVMLARREPLRAVGRDLAALIGGGLLAGAPGIVWLVASGAWPHFLDVFLNWNPAYVADSEPLAQRAGFLFDCLRPWGTAHTAALPLALLALWPFRTPRAPQTPRRLRWATVAGDTPRAASARAVLAALYLGWVAQGALLQKGLDYVHAPSALLACAVIASHRWAIGFAYLVWFVAVAGANHAALAFPNTAAPVVRAVGQQSWDVVSGNHPLADRYSFDLWKRSVREGNTPDTRDAVGRYTAIHCCTRWGELEQVAAFLRTVDPPLGPGEVNCWNDSTHPLYLMLDLDPATRYMHYGTVFGITERGPPPPGRTSRREQIAGAVRASRQRYVVSDLVRMTGDPDAPYKRSSWRAGDRLPVWLPAAERRKYPWNQPVVFQSGRDIGGPGGDVFGGPSNFRAGRYLVHRIDPAIPLGTIRVPPFDRVDRLDEFGPDE